MTTEYRKPLPLPLNSELTKPFWEGAKRHELLVQRCKKCSEYVWYPRELCAICLSPELEWTQVSGEGRLYSYTVIYQPANPAFRGEAPYIYAMVQLNEGPRIVANLVDCPIEGASVDMPVEAVFEDVTPEWTLVKFRPR